MTTFANPEYDIVKVDIRTADVSRDFFYPRCRRCNWAGEMSTNKTFAWNEALDHNRSKCIEPAGEGANSNAL